MAHLALLTTRNWRPASKAAALVSIAVITGAPSPCPLCPVPSIPKVQLDILLLPGAPPVEHTPIDVPFSMVVSPGTGGIRPTKDLAVCNADGFECVPFDHVTPEWTSPPGSTLHMNAPAAGKAAAIRLVACIAARDANSVLSCGRELAVGQRNTPVAMRFGVFLDSFTILHTRAHIKDTVWYGFAGQSDNEPRLLPGRCLTKLAGFVSDARCYGLIEVGDRSDGTYPLSNIKIGDFQWVPGGPNRLKLAVMTLNAGSPLGPSAETAQSTLPMLVGQVASPARTIAHDFTGELNALLGWRGCDGPTAAFAITLNSIDVDGLTRANGLSAIPPQQVFVVPSEVGCGASSKYRVNLTIRRSSWQPPH